MILCLGIVCRDPDVRCSRDVESRGPMFELLSRDPGGRCSKDPNVRSPV